MLRSRTFSVWELAYMVTRKAGIAKVVVVVVLAALVVLSFVLMSQEQTVRDESIAVQNKLIEAIDAGKPITDEEVHELVGRMPHETRQPGKHRLVEEYHWKGPMSSHTVYAYYTTAAAKLLEASSLNQKLDDWEGDDK